MPLGTSAATATDLLAHPTVKPFGSTRALQWDSGPQAFAFTGASGQQFWCKVRASYGVKWPISVSASAAGAATDSFYLRRYHSTNPSEDGSTLVLDQSSTGTLSSLFTYSTAYPTEWVYFQIAAVSTSHEAGALDAAVIMLLGWAHGADGGGGYTPCGSTTVGIKGPQTVRGSTKVGIFNRATDSITDCHDLSAGGTILAGGNGSWGNPLTHETGEPTLNYDLYPADGWSNTSWHKFYMPGAGTVRFVDDRARAAAAVDPTTTLGGTTMGVYSGPPDATYADLTFIQGGAISTDGSTYIGADETVTVSSATWLYVQHAYVAALDQAGGHSAGLPDQLMSWTAEMHSGVLPDPVVGSTLVQIYDHPYVVLTAAGNTVVRASGDVVPPRAIGTPDPVLAGTDVEVLGSVQSAVPDGVAGTTAVAVTYTPDISDNPPITLSVQLSAYLAVVQPSSDAGSPVSSRHVKITTVEMPTPIIVGGRPVIPQWTSQAALGATLRVGANHIRAIDPAPTFDGSGYVNPPPPTLHPWAARWVVDDLPDPPSGGYYWLGNPSSQDGTAGISSSKRLWKPHASTPHAPSWHSFFPFKPSVRAMDVYLPGGGTVHHPKGVHFNSEFIEHMWLDFGGPRRQPFTWVIAAMVVNYPTSHYRHYILDAGRNPDDVGFPRISDSQTWIDRKIHDGLSYRNLIATNPTHTMLTASTDLGTSRAARAKSATNHRPRMFFGVFNGASSYVGDYAAGGTRRAKGSIVNGAAQQHRYYVLGRSQGIMSQDKASHIMVFEIRFWTYALSQSELDEQYGQLSSTYHFNQYRRI